MKRKQLFFLISRIFINILVILLLIYRNKIFNITNESIGLIITVIVFILSIFIVLDIYKSIGKMTDIPNSRRRKDDTIIKRMGSFEEIALMIEKNNILEMIIEVDKKKIKVGCSSDMDHSTGRFFDKKYHINGKEFVSATEFECEFKKIVADKHIKILSLE